MELDMKYTSRRIPRLTDPKRSLEIDSDSSLRSLPRSEFEGLVHSYLGRQLSLRGTLTQQSSRLFRWKHNNDDASNDLDSAVYA